MRVIPFIPEHYYALERKDSKFHTWALSTGGSQLATLSMMGEARTFLVGEKVIAVCGVLRLWPGVGEVFFMPTLGWEKYKLSVVRVLRFYLRVCTQTFTRIQMTCFVDDKYVRFATALGFTPEGMLRKYDLEGNDHIILSKVVE